MERVPNLLEKTLRREGREIDGRAVGLRNLLNIRNQSLGLCKCAIEDMIKNLKVDPALLNDNNLDAPKDRSPSEVTSCISSSSGDATGSFKENDVDQESMIPHQSMYYPLNAYYGYYYPGYEGSLGDEHGYFLSSDGLEIQYPAMQGDNGSLVYYMPGFLPYNPYVPGATIGIDGQCMGHQPYFLSPLSPQPIASAGYFPTLPYGSEMMPPLLWDASLLPADLVHGSGYGGVAALPGSKAGFAVPTHMHTPSKNFPTAKASKLELKGSLPVVDVSLGSGPLNEVKPANKAAAVLAKGCYPVSKFPCTNQGKSGLLYPNGNVNIKANGRGWGGAEKLKTRGKANGISDFDLLNEQNRGPRTTPGKGAFALAVNPAGALLSASNGSYNGSATTVRRDLYNLPDFPTKYDHATFFVIKSYSEDDIHKSIKYNVWASTMNGNKRLDSAYQDAQAKAAQNGMKCPVFLFFSVNASGQFCGVAEMIGPVDCSRNMDFWQQDKWNGFFPVKWHIIKDIPNPHFRHIILENNDNKPVTNSRDTQEIRFPQGIEMLNIFKNYSAKTSILDDFAFYEGRQKAMNDKRIKQSTRLGNIQKLDEVAKVSDVPQSVDLVSAKMKTDILAADEAKE
ncbi:hypothetical protein Scep_011130 [Stephania cephalantha]|uniref:YTH domain-containing family protein n=1 Tax=Stephania cephalantha TaxID=152367 RepID=A0AAP0P5A1_9MAGN